ncbi:DUF6468 domain-containing protein [Siccirubricoccus sp. KC 17139]|uniref:DUF6468 domain-containing protein n=1 Tax=Siccirubricoccus soli TaxID=2899147 RepID=A0ABT1D903_9PROT|nr:DUF6468 domain-containing protein [Siccirubricoccus soli]MCO6418417.1 DUF6468 domain-containing protein [Siccirubricoccus soli]MCP2684552.1 DUF6468 domain-containing protein [Siccirubricoccus soli]
MGWVQTGLDLLVVALLGATLPFAIRLERALRTARQDRAALEGSAAELGEATRLAEAATTRLRATAEGAGRQVAEKLAAAEPLRDDLRYLIERAEALADRLDSLVRSARPLTAEPGRAAPAEPAEARSQAERDLLRALKAVR